MKRIEEINIDNKSVVLRCDFNVPVENNIIKDDAKIKKSLKTINYLLNHNCKVIILSHFGRVKTEADVKVNSLYLVGERLATLLNKSVKFLDNCYGEEVKNVVDNANLGDVLVLENTRIMELYGPLEFGNVIKLAE